MTNNIKSFRDLEIWKKGTGILKEIYSITKMFPKEELYGLTSQMRRAVVSITSNISEGYGRKHIPEYKQFLNIAVGSCSELENQVEIAGILNYIDNIKKEELTDEINHIKHMILKFSRSLR